MKKLIIAAIFPWLAAIFGQKAMAQETPKPAEDKKETQEIIIRKKGSKDVTLNLQINGDNVTINGKPLTDFNDADITINKKKIVISSDMRKIDFDIDNLKFDDFIGADAIKGINIVRDRPMLGVTTEKDDAGAKIRTVTDKSGAEAAGLKTGDIITKINDTKIGSPEDLSDVIGKMKVKDEVKVTYKRGSDKEKTVKATLKEARDINIQSYSFSGPDGSVRSFSVPRKPGIQWRDGGPAFNDITVTGFRRQKLGIKIQDTEEGNGVKILNVDDESPAATAGIKKDDILTELNGKKITNTDEAREQLQKNADATAYPVKVKRNGTEMTLNVKIPKQLKTTSL